MPIGEIDFYGYAGLDLTQIRSSLPLREGDKLSFAGMDQTILLLTQETKQSTGYQPTDVAPVCCDGQGKLMVYIGLPGKSSKTLRYNASPRDSIRLPASIVKLYQQTMDSLMEGVQKQATEDRSQGYVYATMQRARWGFLPSRARRWPGESRQLVFSRCSIPVYGRTATKPVSCSRC